ncbi:hypothetical protein FACS1894211_10540 [Clostridia bacterium]|nr:hypothetical protein FACS1894211_10540 [Clostridia bacterium]
MKKRIEAINVERIDDFRGAIKTEFLMECLKALDKKDPDLEWDFSVSNGMFAVFRGYRYIE